MIRNIAIIAHVDHGKTTLVDQLIKSSNVLSKHETLQDRVMDSNELEKERGITILSKNTAINYKDVKINILDTPGHADFAGEVERIMKLVDGVLLVVDAYDGVMPQTRFVLNEALKSNLKPIVVINKVDRDAARPLQVVDEVFDLFIELGASDEQANFKVAYVSALKGTSSLDCDIATQKPGMNDLLDLIITEIPAPKAEVNGPLQFQGALLDYNEYVGRMAIGKIHRGVLKVGETLTCLRLDGSKENFRALKIYNYLGLHKEEVSLASAGDIVALAGLSDINVGETVCAVGFEEALDPIKISEPTIEMSFSVNTSPFAGLEGKFVTSPKIDERLFRETQKDVSLRVERFGSGEEWLVKGRGELHLGILIESMRREGYEFLVSRPKAILKEEDGITLEPFEYVQAEVPNETIGSVIELFNNHGGHLNEIITKENYSKIIYTIPSRGLIGISTDFLTASKGYGTMTHNFLEYRPVEQSDIGSRKLGVLVATDRGKTTAYAIGALEDRGILFLEPNVEVYEGQIVGLCNREEDLAVNITKAKQLSNQRSATKDNTIVLKRPKVMSLEACLEFINEDELVEVTPRSIRLRKRILNTNERKKYDKYN